MQRVLTEPMRIEELTFFRFVAAAIVMIFHFGREVGEFPGVLVSGPEMVTFFFVLSGFVMWIAHHDKDMPLSRYYWSRVTRIMPVYLLALALTVLSFLRHGRELDPVALGLNLTLLQSWFSPYPSTLNTPAWSLSVEAFFYVSFPFLLLYVHRKALSAGRIAAIALLLWVLTHAWSTAVLNSGRYESDPVFFQDMIYFFPPSHLCSFLFGMAGARLLLERRDEFSGRAGFLWAALAAGVAVVLILNNRDGIEKALGLQFAYGSSLLSPLFVVFITGLALGHSRFTAFLGAGPLKLLGEASYSLYILQFPMHGLYKRFIGPHLDLGPLAEFWALFAFMVGVSIATFLLFEKPANRFLRFQLPALLARWQAARAPGG